MRKSAVALNSALDSALLHFPSLTILTTFRIQSTSSFNVPRHVPSVISVADIAIPYLGKKRLKPRAVSQFQSRPSQSTEAQHTNASRPKSRSECLLSEVKRMRKWTEGRTSQIYKEADALDDDAEDEEFPTFLLEEYETTERELARIVTEYEELYLG